jgi:hypothetical protein
MSPDLRTQTSSDDAHLDHRLSDIGWGLLFILTGLIWMAPVHQVPEGTWLFGVAAILIGVNVVRHLKHIAMSGFSLVLGSWRFSPRWANSGGSICRYWQSV